MASNEAVANEPRLFVGQVPVECTEEDLWPMFSPFGTVRNLHILRGPDSKPRGCAMVLFSKWSEAEAATEGLEGTTALSGGQGRPLVVHFANPRKLPPGQPPEGGLAPKKLFVGQVPRDVTEDMLRPFFESYGEIEHINILRTQRGQSAGCGFVQFRKWSQAEAALEAHNGKTRLGTSEVPLVVKFADAKRKDQAQHHLALGMRGWMPELKHMDPAAAEFAYQLGAQQQWNNQQRLLRNNPMLGGNQMLGGNFLNNQLQNLIPQQGYQGQYPQQHYMPGQNVLQQEREPFLGGNDQDRLQEANFANQLMHTAAGLGSINPLQKGANPRDNASTNPSGSANELAQQLGQLQLANIDNQQDEGVAGYSGFNQGYPQNSRLLGLGPGPGFQSHPGMGYNQQQLLNLTRGPMGAPAMGRPWGQKIGSNDKHNEWKLFVGQVPLEATEETIWELFSPIGPILELYILRNNNGKSRGCAFVTYQVKALAEKAITALNGCHMSSGKILVVKFADRSSANKAPQQNPLLDMYVN